MLMNLGILRLTFHRLISSCAVCRNLQLNSCDEVRQGRSSNGLDFAAVRELHSAAPSNRLPARLPTSFLNRLARLGNKTRISGRVPTVIDDIDLLARLPQYITM